MTDLNWKLQAVGDYNADSKSDIVWRNAVTGQNVTWFMDGSTLASFAYPPDIADANWSIQASGDLNRDGQFDLLWRNGANGLNVWWYMAGANLSAWGFLPDIADLNWKMYGSGDLDGDTKWDIVWRNSASGLNVVWMLNGNAFDRWAFMPDITDLNWKIQAVAEQPGWKGRYHLAEHGHWPERVLDHERTLPRFVRLPADGVGRELADRGAAVRQPTSKNRGRSISPAANG